MKAVILAGEEETRLRPLSIGRPKSMVPLLGRPILEHTVRLLRSQGITEIGVSLYVRPESVMDYFGGGEAQGVQLTFFVEEEPLGTAGSLKSCAAWLGGEDFLVIKGGSLFDLALTELIRFHQEREGWACLGLYRHPTPSERALNSLDPAGRVVGIGPQPALKGGEAGLAGTGICILSPALLERVPEGEAFDLEGDLFPALIEEEIPLYGHALEGYWRDLTDCPTYLECVCDALSGKIKLDMGFPQRAPGIWSARELPPSTALVPPCWIGENVTLGEGVLIGPHTVLSQGAAVERRTMVQRSVLLEGACAGPRATLYGAILCRGAAARRLSLIHI